MFKADYFEKFFLQILKSLLEFTVFILHFVIKIFLTFSHHQVQVTFTIDFTEFKCGITWYHSCKIYSLLCLLVENFLLNGISQLLNLDLLAP